jgi:DNA-binding transcriptional LysR family regulator
MATRTKPEVIAGDFSDERLKYLYMSAKLGTMRAAADALGVAPSSVSRQIAQLERYLRVPLVEKSSHKVRLTEAGQHVVDHYRERLAQKEVLLARLADLKGLRSGRYTLAVGEGFISTVLLSTLQSFTEKHPGVRLDIVTAPTHEVISMVSEDLAHLGFVFEAPPDPRIRTRFTIPQPLKAIVGARHPMAGRSAIRLAELADQPLILPRETFRIREILMKAERDSELQLLPAISTNSLQLMREAARSGMGVAIMSELSIVDDLDAGRLRAIVIEEPLMLSTKAEVITRLGRELPSGVNVILDILARVLERWRATHH